MLIRPGSVFLVPFLDNKRGFDPQPHAQQIEHHTQLAFLWRLRSSRKWTPSGRKPNGSFRHIAQKRTIFAKLERFCLRHLKWMFDFWNEKTGGWREVGREPLRSNWRLCFKLQRSEWEFSGEWRMFRLGAIASKSTWKPNYGTCSTLASWLNAFPPCFLLLKPSAAITDVHISWSTNPHAAKCYASNGAYLARPVSPVGRLQTCCMTPWNK